MRNLISLATFVIAAPLALAQTPTPQSAPAPPVPPIAYPSVAAALAALQARDGSDAVVTHADGWTVVAEPVASTQWSFTPSGHAAYPAVVRRVIVRAPDGAVSVDTSSLCEAPEPACAALLAEFSKMNDRIAQAVKARTRPARAQAPQ